MSSYKSTSGLNFWILTLLCSTVLYCLFYFFFSPLTLLSSFPLSPFLVSSLLLSCLSFSFKQVQLSLNSTFEISSPHFFSSPVQVSSPYFSFIALLTSFYSRNGQRTKWKRCTFYSLLIPVCDPLVTGVSRKQGIVGYLMAEQLWWGQGSAVLTTACCQGRGGGAVVARVATGFVVLPMEHGGGKTGGRDKEKEKERMRRERN